MQMKRTKRHSVFSLTAIALFMSVLTVAQSHAADLVRVGTGPFVSGGGFYIARDKGYFKKMGLEIDTRQYIDGSMAVPSMIAGELEITNLPAAANLFNSIAKGAPLVVVLDWGHNKIGRAYTATNVTQELYDQGLHGLADFAMLKGKRIGVGALGSINQYNIAKGLEKVGLNPAKDVQWVVNVAQPDLMKMLGQKQLDATDLAYQFGVFANQNKWGPIVATGDQIAPGGQIAAYVARKDFVEKKRDVMIRYAVAYLQGVKEFNAAAGAPDKYPEIIEILAKNTALNKPELLKAIAPHWSYINEDGMPQVDSIMDMQDFWSGPNFGFVEKKVSREQIFDLTVAKEAKARLDKDKPFGN
jgi:NitT/TauT family transport system substrate-binding protein